LLTLQPLINFTVVYNNNNISEYEIKWFLQNVEEKQEKEKDTVINKNVKNVKNIVLSKIHINDLIVFHMLVET